MEGSALSGGVYSEGRVYSEWRGLLQLEGSTLDGGVYSKWRGVL